MNPYPYPQNKATVARGPQNPAPAIQTGPTPAAPNPALDAYNALPASTRAYMHAPGSPGAAYSDQQVAQSAADFGGMSSGQQFDAALARSPQVPSYSPAASSSMPSGSAGGNAPRQAPQPPVYTDPVRLPAAPAPVISNQPSPVQIPSSSASPLMSTPLFEPDLRLPAVSQGGNGSRAFAQPVASNPVVNAMMKRYRPRGW